MKVYAPHLVIIRQSIRAIESYRPENEDAFLSDPMVQDAVLMRLQVIGEHMTAIRRIDEARFDELAPETWYQLIGLRNVISHGYEAIKWDRIWRMISQELPELRTSLSALDGE